MARIPSTQALRALESFARHGTVWQAADELNLTRSAVSHQLRILKQARLVRFDRDGRSIIYSLADDHVHTMLAQGMTHICE